MGTIKVVCMKIIIDDNKELIEGEWTLLIQHVDPAYFFIHTMLLLLYWLLIYYSSCNVLYNVVEVF